MAGDRLIGGGSRLQSDRCLSSGSVSGQAHQGGYPDTYPKVITVPIHLQVCPFKSSVAITMNEVVHLKACNHLTRMQEHPRQPITALFWPHPSHFPSLPHSKTLRWPISGAHYPSKREGPHLAQTRLIEHIDWRLRRPSSFSLFPFLLLPPPSLFLFLLLLAASQSVCFCFIHSCLSIISNTFVRVLEIGVACHVSLLHSFLKLNCGLAPMLTAN